MIRIAVLLLSLMFTLPVRAAPIENSDGFWHEWNDATFAEAARDKKFVIVSLQSWWCRWCHVMNRETWAKAEVRAILKDKFIPVYVDQDSRPDISQRYERWGWPATIIFGPDGTEIVKLRGFYSPEFFVPILIATIEDPSPVNYPDPGGAERERTLASAQASIAPSTNLDRLHPPCSPSQAWSMKPRISLRCASVSPLARVRSRSAPPGSG